MADIEDHDPRLDDAPGGSGVSVGEMLEPPDPTDTDLSDTGVFLPLVQE